MWVPGNQPRSLFKGEEGPTDQEKIAAYDSFIANSGTYELAGTTLTFHPMVARSPNFMAGGVSKSEVRIEGTTLWLTQKNTARETRLKLSRVE